MSKGLTYLISEYDISKNNIFGQKIVVTFFFHYKY